MDAMLDTTSTAAGTNNDNNTEHPPSPPIPLLPICSSCQIRFDNVQEQRIHAKQPWHVYNLKRRMASLPPITLETFDSEVEKQAKAPASKTLTSKMRASSFSDEESSDDDVEESTSPLQCLFCNQDFGSDDDGLAMNLEHMHLVHEFSIPNPELVVDTQSFVAYLATEVRSWHECLYCGATKSSTLSIQSHMRDKAHCLLNLDREPELLGFWEHPQHIDGEAATPDQERPVDPSATEMHLASGKVIGSKHTAPTAKKASSERQVALTSAAQSAQEPVSSTPPLAAPQPASGRQLARREEMSILGLSIQQRQALVSAEKKAQRSEAVARRAREWVYARGANSQKFDQLDNQAKFGKQNHKLLPR